MTRPDPSVIPLPDLRAVARAVAAGQAHLAIGGVVPAARSLVVAGLLAGDWGRSPRLVVVGHPADADELAAGLELLAPRARVAVVPAETAAPYQGVEAPLAARLQLVEVLDRVARGAVDVVVAAVRCLTTPIPEPASVAAATLHLALGQRLDPLDLAARLVAAGYRRVDVVEEIGDFALRGWVVDLHAGGAVAFRLELDDDLVEAIRPFDPATQRSSGEAVTSLAVGPLDPFPASEEQHALLAEALAEDYPVVAEAARTGSERRLWWGAAHLVEPSTTWLDLLPSVVICDRDDIMGELGRWFTVQEREWRTLSDRSTALPPPARLLVDRDLIAERLEAVPLRIEHLEVHDPTTHWWRVPTSPAESFVHRIPDLVPTLRERRAQDLVQVLAVASDGEERRFAHLLRNGEVEPVAWPARPTQVAIARCRVDHGFLWHDTLAVYGRRMLTAVPPPRRRSSGLGSFRSDLRDLKAGDLVVHVDHGIGRFVGFRRVEVEGRSFEMLNLEYHGGDALLVPVERADLIQRFSAAEGDKEVKLDRLGGATWRRRKARVEKAVREIAGELLRLAAVRKASVGQASSPDSPWQREFEDAFEWDLTEDQVNAVADIKADMEATRPMDRLLCGDVGYGKTEVAIRASFKAVLDGRQVAVLAPTTILAGQHLRTFTRRMQGFPVEIRMLSRFVSPAEVKEVLAGLAEGTVDVVIGTHRLLAKDVRFRDLGLVVVDEEQRFGVAQKERLKHLRTEVDVVSMSATPIPRTLNMAMSGLRDISVIETPPRDRQAVETTVLEFSEAVVREAVLYEKERGGQVFFVHNRVRSIGAMAAWLDKVVPEARVVTAHGQMSEHHLERAMRTFLDGEADVLLATAIVENGLDIPNANTLLVNRADRFGLAQLYQLRGRVGRSDRLAFAYFLVPPGQALSATARARLAAIQEFCELGAGFRIAARDLEIRGAGNMLGAEQHGYIEAVGFETYCELLEEAVAELAGQPLASRREVELRLGLDLQLPEEYIPEPALRLSFYKRLAACSDDLALADLMSEVRDRFGAAPAQLEDLVAAQRLRVAARAAGIVTVARRGRDWRLQIAPDVGLPPGLTETLATWQGARVSPAGEVVLPVASADPSGDLPALRAALAAMAG